MTDNERPQDNNALVPLDFQVIFDMLFDRTQYSVDSCKDIAEEICAKFGKDNNCHQECQICETPLSKFSSFSLCDKCKAKLGKDNNETIAGSSFKILNNKEEDIYTFADGKPIGKDNSGMVPDEKELSLLFDMLKTHKVNYLPELLTQPTGIIGIDQAFSTFKIWLSNFSQQPPKERKVSLEME